MNWTNKMHKSIILIIACSLCVASCHSKIEKDECFRNIAKADLYNLSYRLLLYSALHPEKFDTTNNTFDDVQSLQQFYIKTLPSIRTTPCFQVLLQPSEHCKLYKIASKIDPEFYNAHKSLDENWMLLHGYYQRVPDHCNDYAELIHLRWQQLELYDSYNKNHRSILQDPWWNDYKIEISSDKTEILISSAGPDLQFGTADDIKSNEKFIINNYEVQPPYVVSDILERSKRYTSLFSKARGEVNTQSNESHNK